MPSPPGMSITKAAEPMQTQNKIIKSFPEAVSVYGKAVLRPLRPGTDRDVRNRHQPQAGVRVAHGHDDRQADRGVGPGTAVPGVSNAWTMPIKARIDMLSTGIRTPIGIKVFGKDLGEMERLAREIVETVVKQVPGTTSALQNASQGAFTSILNPTGRNWRATAWG